jgi:membrane-associated phospholipid phosphatase
MTKLLCILASLTLPARDLPQDASNLWQTDNALVVGAGASLAAAAYATKDSPRSELSFVDGPARITDVYGAGTFNIPVAIGLWGFGHATHNEPVRDFGHGLTRALGLTQLVVGPMKVLSHRLRPNEANHRSFPSGHTANTFAMARFIQHETSTTISLPFYALAVLTGAGRVEGRQHYLSDVLMGATLGVIVGSTVGRDRSSGRVSWQPMTQAPGLRLRVALN